MIWIQTAYLLALLYLMTQRTQLPPGGSLRAAWVWFALIPLSQFMFSLFRAGNMRNPYELALVEVWASGIDWLLLSLSFLCLTGLFGADEPADAEPGTVV